MISGNVWEFALVKFTAVDVYFLQLPEKDLLELNTDQKLLYKLCEAAVNGSCVQKLADSRIGPLNHSRWMTTASRIVRLHFSHQNPSTNLLILVTYICGVYYPTIAYTKLNNDVVNGARIIHKEIELQNQYVKDKELLKIIRKITQITALPSRYYVGNA